MPPASFPTFAAPPYFFFRFDQKIDQNSDVILVSSLVVFGASWVPLGLPFGAPLGSLGRPSGLKLAPKTVLDGFWAPKRVSSKLPRFPLRNHTFWPPGAPQDGPRAPREGFKIDPRRYLFVHKIWIDFGTVFGRSWLPLGPPGGAQEHPKRPPRGSKNR